MNAVETLWAEISAVEAGDWQRARSLLADDFSFSGAVPQPIGPDAWLRLHQAFSAAMPDFSFNLSGVHERDGKVFAQVRLTGTQTHELVVPGIEVVAPTGIRVSLPAEDIVVIAPDGTITNIDVNEVAGGGLLGLLAQLGVSVPARG